MAFPHAHIKNGVRLHRTVVLPAFQGIGLGGILTKHIADMYHRSGHALFTTTTHPARIRQLSKSPDWICTHKGRVSANTTATAKGASFNKSNSRGRITTSWKYAPGKGK
ncbi:MULTISPECIES: hypothetical protein [unclassified Spirosoma]|uniref:hypothetical protein n=1 Tax=unclassified Spirosoma TaxID=2621999 RepID=UPI0009624521|nr:MULTISPECIES: hypothetical protein [unclassified Spirosoma]MBN8824461.1 hypothetical protein [Spirosoma sp.]OJW70076.1 MAG: hypothetical protein BGO59_25720 [Spirosoma sp. 48-14]